MENNARARMQPSGAFPISQPNFKKCVDGCYAPIYSKLSLMTKLTNFSIIPSVYACDEKSTVEGSKGMAIDDIPVLITDEEVQAVLAKETGRDRLTEMFSKNDKPAMFQQNISPEMKFVRYITECVTCIGFVFGVSRGARLAAEERMTKHLTARYPHKVTRLRRYYDAIIIKGVKTGFVYGLTAGAFAGVFMLTSQSISVYRNKSSFYEYMCAGGVSATLSRLHIGPKAMLSGGVLGASLGTLGGMMIYGLLTFANETQEQKHYWVIYQRLRHAKQVAVMSQS